MSGGHRKARHKDDGAASAGEPANGLPPERAAALMAEIDRIAEAKGFRHAGVTRWEAFETAAGLNRGALWGARQGSRTQPETLAALARWFGESPWHLLSAAYGLTHQEGLQYLREWAERHEVTPQMLEETRRYVSIPEEDRQSLLQLHREWLQSWLRILRPSLPGAAPSPSARPSEPEGSAEPDAAKKPQTPDR